MKRYILLCLVLMAFAYPQDCSTFSFNELGSLRDDSATDYVKNGGFTCAWESETLFGQVSFGDKAMYAQQREYYGELPCKDTCQAHEEATDTSYKLTRDNYFSSGSSDTLIPFKSVSDDHTIMLYKDHAIIVYTKESQKKPDAEFVHRSDHTKLVEEAMRLIDGEGAAPQKHTFSVTAAADAEVRLPGGKWMPLEKGMELPEGAEISTALDPIELEVGGGDFKAGENVITLYPQSQIKLAMFNQFSSALEAQIFLKAGKVAARVNPRKGGGTDFSVKSPIATTSIEGTEFSMSYDEASQTGDVEVTRGTVSVATASSSEKVTEGGHVRIGKDLIVDVIRMEPEPGFSVFTYVLILLVIAALIVWKMRKR